jgi:hypothetical protein
LAADERINLDKHRVIHVHAERIVNGHHVGPESVLACADHHVYGSDESNRERYSPSEIIDAVPTVVTGDPKPHRISTSHIERQNLTVRMQMRRFTRLTNAFSKKLENLKAALALHFAWYNFCRVHSTLRVTPAMAAGISNEIWLLDRLVA